MILRDFSARLLQRFGRTGLVCRYGGEEFALLFPGGSLPQVRTALEGFLSEVAADPATTTHGELHYTVSAGLTDDPGDSLESMLKLADATLYRAKQEGRNRLVCSCG
jgi:diguanylate cyclase (GGDEF)-like protein